MISTVTRTTVILGSKLSRTENISPCLTSGRGEFFLQINRLCGNDSHAIINSMAEF